MPIFRRRINPLVLVVAATVVAIPVLEFVTGSFGAPIWTNLSFGLLGFALLTMGFIPWVRARWARSLLRSLKVAEPDSVCAIILMEDDEGRATKMAVLKGNQQAIFVYRSSDQSEVFPWDGDSSLAFVERGSSHLVTLNRRIPGGEPLLLPFVVLERTGRRPMKVWEAEQLVRAVTK